MREMLLRLIDLVSLYIAANAKIIAQTAKKINEYFEKTISLSTL